ncbi:MAG: Fic family protein [Proteobacteria bacterium]|nr:Fic family protein [Pseudomonadota bacterium]
MPKLVSRKELDMINHALPLESGKASIEEILRNLEEKVPRRTLQRWLSKFVQSGEILSDGNGRATRYRRRIAPVVVNYNIEPSISRYEVREDTFIPMSEEGTKIREHIQRSFHVRKKVGYNRNFLDDYQPNKTMYLTESIRDHLKEISRLPRDGDSYTNTYSKEILHRLLIDLSWNSSRLEGNTYSLLETELLISKNEIADEKTSSEARMILNHKEAIEFLVEEKEIIGFNRHTIFTLHALLARGLLPDPRSRGRLRSTKVGIGKSAYTPTDIPQLIEECFQHILNKAEAIKDPFEQAFFVLVHLPYLQPFEDVNKRTSRLSANIPLIKNNLCPLSFIHLPNDFYVAGVLGVYELNRIELMRDVFVYAYECSADQYAEVQHVVNYGNSFEFRYRKQMDFIVPKIIRQKMNKREATKFVQQWAHENINPVDQLQFVELMETELLFLHEGSFGIYYIKPDEFAAWKKVWD